MTHLQVCSVNFEIHDILPNVFTNTGLACTLQVFMVVLSSSVHPVYVSGTDKYRSKRLKQAIGKVSSILSLEKRTMTRLSF